MLCATCDKTPSKRTGQARPQRRCHLQTTARQKYAAANNVSSCIICNSDNHGNKKTDGNSDKGQKTNACTVTGIAGSWWPVLPLRLSFEPPCPMRT